jgi:hypothetical protein
MFAIDIFFCMIGTEIVQQFFLLFYILWHLSDNSH